MNDKILCPYCGCEMERGDCLYELYYICPNCESESPSVSPFDYKTDTEDELWERARAAALRRFVNGNTTDGYHTFNELYHHRAVLFSVIVNTHPEIAWKSKRHSDGTMFDGMFIVGIKTPQGQATYHYDIDPYWDMFECEELELAPDWDGHTPDDAINRIRKLRRFMPLQKPLTLEEVQAIQDGEPVFIERYDGNWAWALFGSEGGTEYPGLHYKPIWNGYGLSWRCWRTRPTDEERQAAGWEE